MHFLGSRSVRVTGWEKKVPDDVNYVCCGPLVNLMILLRDLLSLQN